MTEKEVTAKDVLNTLLPVLGFTQKDAAESIGWTKMHLGSKLTRDTLRVCEFLRILDAVGVEIAFRRKDTGEIIKTIRRGHGHPIKGMADGVIYNTAVSVALSNTFYADGVNEYDANGQAQELYIDQEDRYFIAEYNINDPKKERVIAASTYVAEAFIEKFGTTIEKK